MKKEPWHDCPRVFKDEKTFLNWLRSQTRRIWSRHPIKLEYKKKLRYKASVGKFGKDVWVIDCEICGKPHRETQTDHLKGGYGFTDWTSFCEWAKMILWVTFDDIRELCPDCHAVVTLSQKLGVTWDEAVVQKEVLSIIKQKKDKSWLAQRGITPATSIAKRRIQITEELRKDND